MLALNEGIKLIIPEILLTKSCAAYINNFYQQSVSYEKRFGCRGIIKFPSVQL